MRIIAGSAKGLILQAPPSITRPTMDRVRAAIFSILGDRVPEAHVLDLFAGTGAMGIEALSRGAASALFIDHQKKATELIHKNLATTKLVGQIQTSDALTCLDRLTQLGSTFDLIFADPPYAVKEHPLSSLKSSKASPFSESPESKKGKLIKNKQADDANGHIKDGENLAASLLRSPHLLNIMAEDALLILECEKKQSLPENLHLDILVDRTYGISRIVILRRNN